MEVSVLKENEGARECMVASVESQLPRSIENRLSEGISCDMRDRLRWTVLPGGTTSCANRYRVSTKTRGDGGDKDSPASDGKSTCSKLWRLVVLMEAARTTVAQAFGGNVGEEVLLIGSATTDAPTASED